MSLYYRNAIILSASSFYGDTGTLYLRIILFISYIIYIYKYIHIYLDEATLNDINLSA